MLRIIVSYFGKNYGVSVTTLGIFGFTNLSIKTKRMTLKIDACEVNLNILDGIVNRTRIVNVLCKNVNVEILDGGEGGNSAGIEMKLVVPGWFKKINWILGLIEGGLENLEVRYTPKNVVLRILKMKFDSPYYTDLGIQTRMRMFDFSVRSDNFVTKLDKMESTLWVAAYSKVGSVRCHLDHFTFELLELPKKSTESKGVSMDVIALFDKCMGFLDVVDVEIRLKSIYLLWSNVSVRLQHSCLYDKTLQFQKLMVGLKDSQILNLISAEELKASVSLIYLQSIHFNVQQEFIHAIAKLIPQRDVTEPSTPISIVDICRKVPHSLVARLPLLTFVWYDEKKELIQLSARKIELKEGCLQFGLIAIDMSEMGYVSLDTCDFDIDEWKGSSKKVNVVISTSVSNMIRTMKKIAPPKKNPSTSSPFPIPAIRLQVDKLDFELKGSESSFGVSTNFLFQYFERNHWLVHLFGAKSFVENNGTRIPYLETPLFLYEKNQDVVTFKSKDLLFHWTVLTKLQISEMQKEMRDAADPVDPSVPIAPSTRKTTQVQIDGFRYYLKYTCESELEFQMARLETNCYETGYFVDDLRLLVCKEQIGFCKRVEYQRNEEYQNTFSEYQSEMSGEETPAAALEMRQLLFEGLKFSFANKTVFGEAIGQMFLARRYMNELLEIKPVIPTKANSLLMIVKDFRVELGDNPLETCLTAHQQLWPTEAREREERTLLLKRKAKEKGIVPTEDMFKELDRQNSKIYLEKLKLLQKTNEHQHLLSCEVKEFQIAFKREAYTQDGILNWMSQFGLPLRKVGDKFAHIIVSFYQHTSWNIGETAIWVRGFPFPLLKAGSVSGSGTFCYWKYPPGKKETIMKELVLERDVMVHVPWHLVPSMLFFTANVDSTDLEMVYAKSWSPMFVDIQILLDRILPKSLDPSMQKFWWDKLRHRFHGQFEIHCRPKVRVLSSGNNTYEPTDSLDWTIHSLYARYAGGRMYFKVLHVLVMANPSLSMFPSMAEMPFLEGFLKWSWECLGDPNNPFFEFAIPEAYQVSSKRVINSKVDSVPTVTGEQYDSYKNWKTTKLHATLALFVSPHETLTISSSQPVIMMDPLSTSFLIRFISYYIFPQWRIQRARTFRYGMKRVSSGLFQFAHYNLEFNGFVPRFVWSNGVLTNFISSITIKNLFLSVTGNPTKVVDTVQLEINEGDARLFCYAEDGFTLSQEMVQVEKILFTKKDIENDYPAKLQIDNLDGYYSASTRDALLIYYDLIDQFLFQREYKRKNLWGNKKTVGIEETIDDKTDDLLSALLIEKVEKEAVKEIVDKKFKIIVNSARVILIGDLSQGVCVSCPKATFEFLRINSTKSKFEMLGLLNDLEVSTYTLPGDEDESLVLRKLSNKEKKEEAKRKTSSQKIEKEDIPRPEKSLIEKSPWIIHFTASNTKSLEIEIPELSLNLSALDIKRIQHIFTHVIVPKKMVRKVVTEDYAQTLVYQSALDPNLITDVDLAQKKCEAILIEIKQLEAQVAMIARVKNKEEALMEISRLKNEITQKKMVYQAMKETLLKKVDESRSKNTDLDLLVSMVIHNTAWNMMDEEDVVFMKANLTLLKATVSKHKDYSMVYSVICHYFNVKNHMPNPIFDDLLVPFNDNYGDEEYMLRVYMAKNNGVGGIRIVDHLEIELAPIHMNLTYKAYKLLWRYFFPKTEKIIAKNPSLKWKTISKFTAKEDVDVMKYRARNLVVFNYVKIHDVKLFFSLKGVPEEKMWKIVRNFEKTKLELNEIVYTQKTVTWNELFENIKKDMIKQAVSYIPSSIKSAIWNKFTRKTKGVVVVAQEDKKLEHTKKLMGLFDAIKGKGSQKDDLAKSLFLGQGREQSTKSPQKKK